MNPKKYFTLLVFCLAFILTSTLSFAQINFTSSNLANFNLVNPTSLQFGPDGKLYVSQQDGTISVLTIQKNGNNNYTVTSTETILLVKQIPNHYDDGTLKFYDATTNKREVTGIYVTGTSTNPILYVSSSDSDIGGGGAGDRNLCTNSGIISKLTKSGSTWQKMDLVRGLPRSEENHAPNGMQMNETTQTLYLAIGGITNAGSPSKNFALTTEYALSGCILSINLATIEAMPVKGSTTANPYKYDLPTVDDPTRANNADGTDINDPFGGNDGLNQAKIVAGGPVQVFATGFRNVYDLVITKTPGKANRMYTIDNGANYNWGGFPDKEGTPNVTNNYVVGEPGSVNPSGTDGTVNNLDGLHKIDLNGYVSGSYYGGHPCPIRANPSGAGLYTHSGNIDTDPGIFRTSKTDPKYPLPADWPPVPLNMANPIEGDFQNPGITNTALITFPTSTNGICEYTASSFNGALKGDLFAASYDGTLYRVRTANDGSVLNNTSSRKINTDPAFASGFGSNALDITSQGDGQVFPGTMWVANYGSASITIFEPQAIACTGANSTTLDEDGDGFKNSDEIANSTDPCNAASKPHDYDNDFISDLNDPDDDNDGLPDTLDPFAIDKNNGSNTTIPLSYNLFNNDPGTGFYGLGFTGLMTNKTSNYATLFDDQNLIAGGAIGAFTIDEVSAGDAQGNLNNQENAFQFGVKVNSSTPSFKVRSVMLANFFNNATPAGFQSQGIYIGNGDQDNYLKVVLNANNGSGGILVMMENQGVVTSSQFSIPKLPSSSADLSINVNPAAGTATVEAILDGKSIAINNTFTLTGPLLQVVQGSSAMAVGIISTSRNATPFNATWDLIEVVPYTPTASANPEWKNVTTSDGSLPTARHEDAFVKSGNKFYLLGGRTTYEKKPVNEYDPATNTWKTKSFPPIQMHHFQAVSYNNLIYVVCAFTNGYPNETPVPNIYIYNPATDTWSVGDPIPAARQRGAAGVVVYNNKMYVAGGIVNGHMSGFVDWFDEYNPATGEWKVLTSAPRARDHFHAAMVGTKLYLAGGRTTSGATNQVLNLTIPQVDIYDFTTNTWSTNAYNIPTQRAGCTTVAIGNEIIVIGGESLAHLVSHNEAEAMDVTTGKWRSLDTLNTGRQATQAIVSNGNIYITAGSGNRGSTPELNSTEVYNYSVQTPTPSAQVTPGSLDFGSVNLNNTLTKQVTVSNTGGTNITISQVTIEGTNASNYSENFTTLTVLTPGNSKIISVTFNASSLGTKTANLKITISELASALNVSLSGTGTNSTSSGAWTALYFVNAGGNAVSSNGNNWTGDTQTTPSTYTNQANSFSKTATLNFAGTNSTDAPNSIFSSFRWDGGVKGDVLLREMQYNFPVSDVGIYKVDLYFTEPTDYMAVPGKRVFDIMIEDTIRSNNFDISAEVAFNNTLKKTYQVYVKDGMVSIALLHEVEIPLIFGVAVSKKSAAPLADVSPTSINYGSVNLNTSSTKQVTVKNTGGTNITISQVTLEGTNAANFTEDFTTQTVLTPGVSKIINVTFTPTTTGGKSANLKITTLELSPVSVALSGTGNSNTTPTSVVTITNPVDGSSFTQGSSITIQATVNNSSASYYKINCPDATWRKLKIGYDPNNLYTAYNNVTSGGNNKIEIVVKAVTTFDWNKIQIRPSGSTTNPLVIASYVNGATTQSDGYKKITIPLSSFDASIDFTKLSNIEFPYSTGAGVFEMNLQSITFTGGTTPFNWFGNGKFNNRQDGQGGGGQLTALLVQGKTVSNVAFYQNNTLLGTDNASPYQYTWANLPTGNYSLTAKATYSDNSSDISNSVVITVNASTAMKMAKAGESPVLYKVMANSNAIEDTSWTFDLPFVTSGSSIVTTTDKPITRESSVPMETPMEIFKSERSTTADSLKYNFPVDKGGEVEVRLYFAETEFDQPDKRVMDVAIEDSVQLSRYDIYREDGKNKGVMKTYKTVSDGSVNINLIRIRHNPSIRAVEIHCLNDKCNSKNVKMTAKKKHNIFSAAYPNPFVDKLSLELPNSITERVIVRIHNNVGRILKEQEVSLSQGTIVEMDLSTLSSGTYYMQILSGDEVNETIKIVKR